MELPNSERIAVATPQQEKQVCSQDFYTLQVLTAVQAFVLNANCKQTNLCTEIDEASLCINNRKVSVLFFCLWMFRLVLLIGECYNEKKNSV